MRSSAYGVASPSGSAGAPQAVTTSGALLDALSALGIHRIAVATPYVESLTSRLGEFLGEAGIDTVGGAQLGLSGEIWKVPYGVTAQLIRDADSPDAQAVFASCTNLPTYDLIAPLEAELGEPVLTAHQVTPWAALRRAGSAAIDRRSAAARLNLVTGPTRPMAALSGIMHFQSGGSRG